MTVFSASPPCREGATQGCGVNDSHAHRLTSGREVRVPVLVCGDLALQWLPQCPICIRRSLLLGAPVACGSFDGWGIISPANCIRQPLSSTEIGLAKQ